MYEKIKNLINKIDLFIITISIITFHIIYFFNFYLKTISNAYFY